MSAKKTSVLRDVLALTEKRGFPAEELRKELESRALAKRLVKEATWQPNAWHTFEGKALSYYAVFECHFTVIVFMVENDSWTWALSNTELRGKVTSSLEEAKAQAIRASAEFYTSRRR